jgi:hypothetical protein
MSPEKDLDLEGPAQTSLQASSQFRLRLAKAQTAGRWLLLAFVLIGALGLLGGKGPLALQTARLTGLGELQLPRYVRYQSPFQMSLSLDEVSTGPVRLRLSHSLARAISIDHAWPLPVASGWDRDGLVIEFAPGTTRVALRARPDRIGDLGGDVALQGQAPVRVPLWGYP